MATLRLLGSESMNRDKASAAKLLKSVACSDDRDFDVVCINGEVNARDLADYLIP